MAKRAAKSAAKPAARASSGSSSRSKTALSTAPVDVRVVALPEEFATLLQDLPARIKSLEDREAALRETVARLEERIEALKDEKPDMLMTATAPGAAREHRPDADNQVVDIDQLVERFGHGIFGALPEDSSFTVQNADVELTGAAGLDPTGNAKLGVNPRQAVTGDTATRVKFTLRRRSKTKVVE